MVQTFTKLYKKISWSSLLSKSVTFNLNPDSQPLPPLATYLGVVLKGQTHSLSHEGIDPILHFPLPLTIKQLRAFLGVTGFCRIWIPRYAALSRHLFMLLLIFLFGSYIINALKTVSPPPIKMQTKPVHLRKPVNPWPMRKPPYTGPPPKPFLLGPL
jgi:hypothetical protein